MLDELLSRLSEVLSPAERDRPRDKLLQARALLRDGQFAQAAPLFEELATLARQNNMPGLAGEAALRAAQCYVRSGNMPQADERGHDAVRFLIQAGHYERVAQVAPRIIQALERNGRQSEAQALREELRRAAPGARRLGRRPVGPLRRRFGPPEARPLVQRQLPTSCPSCGAPVRADEVDWTGPANAACAYCGAGLQVTIHKIE